VSRLGNSFAEGGDGSQDLIRRLGPSEGRGLLVVEGEVVPNRRLQLLGATERTAPDAALGDLLGGHPKPAMHGHLKTGHREP